MAPVNRFYIATTVSPVADPVTGPPFTEGGPEAWTVARALVADKIDIQGDASSQQSETLATYGVNVRVLRAVSAPLDAQTISGSVTSQFCAQENLASANFVSQIALRVVSGDGTTERGVLYAGDTTATGMLTSEWSTLVGGINRSFPRPELSPAALTPVTVQAGDRLVVELGYTAYNTLTTPRTGTIFYGDVGADLPEDETTTGGTGWIEFSTSVVVLDEGGTPAGGSGQLTATSQLTITGIKGVSGDSDIAVTTNLIGAGQKDGKGTGAVTATVEFTGDGEKRVIATGHIDVVTQVTVTGDKGAAGPAGVTATTETTAAGYKHVYGITVVADQQLTIELTGQGLGVEGEWAVLNPAVDVTPNRGVLAVVQPIEIESRVRV